MTSFAALDVALGLAFVFFLLSILVSALTEAVAWLTKQRSRQLDTWLAEAFRGSGNTDWVSEFKRTPAYQALQLSAGRNPSYIAASHFVGGVVQAASPIAADAAPAAREAPEAWTALGADLLKLNGTTAGDSLMGVYRRANGDLERFRHDAEAWFDDQMERLSGQYRRWVAWINLALGAGLILALNANAIRIAQLLWSDPTVRSAVVSNTGATGTGHQTSGQAIKTLQNLPLPLGWSGGWAHSGYHLWLPLLYAILGGLLSLAAVSLGAPFWFDTLSQLARLRTTGAPPAATGAVRRGEGDQRRVGPSMWPVAEPDETAPTRSRRR
ncbi:MAG TPA: hypothetical protein VHS27_17805 [Gaiellales bacterium]|nr:hypothetical protein [Gaiellales bacterium]